MQYKYLALGIMPENASPETHIAAGMWCFLDKEDPFQKIERYCLIPQNFSEEECESKVREYSSYGFAWLKYFCERCNCDLKSPLHEETYRILYGKYLFTMISFIAFAEMIINSAIRHFGDQELTVYGTECCLFESTSEMFYGNVRANGFAGILLHVLKQKVPKNWKIVVENFAQKNKKYFSTNKRSFLQKIRMKIKTYWFEMKLLPVEQLKFNLLERLCLSVLCLKSITNGNSEKMPFSIGIQQWPTETSYIPEWLNDFISSNIPVDLIDLHKEIYPVFSIFRYFIGSSTDRKSLLNYARLAEGGAKIWTVQHAPLYLFLSRINFLYISETLYSGFISLGVRRDCKLPSATINIGAPAVYKKIKDTHKKKSKDILYIVLDQWRPLIVCINDLHSWNIVNDYKNVKYILGNLSKNIEDCILIRPYFLFPSAIGGSIDSAKISFLKNRPKYYGSNLEMLKKCKLLVVNYIASSLGEAMIMNTPCIWIFSLFPKKTLSKEAIEVIEAFQKAQILHDNVESAIAFINQNWNSIEEWWNSELVQNARALYLERDICVSRSLSYWIKNMLAARRAIENGEITA